MGNYGGVLLEKLGDHPFMTTLREDSDTLLHHSFGGIRESGNPIEWKSMTKTVQCALCTEDRTIRFDGHSWGDLKGEMIVFDKTKTLVTV